ncbi:hypothetical protein [Streptomyces sp. H27-D2]|uniref:hypothetical protein n=1 Tax=Streptomyces sp. H27-D2 TaxID=3046304 RepID=UPI002DC03C1D|nr:hypothetical protein [Streptomyces sp. H27-D2]MEC4016559.1 hypothetical protein [Streptomyces sp. H27-D2]
MSIRHTTKALRGVAALALAVGLAFTVAGCGGDGDGKTQEPASSSQGKAKSGDSDKQDTKTPDPKEVLAELKGEKGIVFTINSAVRDSGGFVTVSGQIKNTGSEIFVETSGWRGKEQELAAGGDSLGGATLIDKEGKKRYYVLRDTDGQPLTSTGLTQIDAGKSVEVFAQFPAPPDSTAEVDFQLPTFPTATIKISE